MSGLWQDVAAFLASIEPVATAPEKEAADPGPNQGSGREPIRGERDELST